MIINFLIIIQDIEMDNLVNKNRDNRGIELLRIISMYMVVVLHCLGHGGILKNTGFLTVNNNIAWFLEILCYGAVNIFGLISGYVCLDTKIKYKRIMSLYLQALFYSVAISLIFRNISFTMFLPICTNKWWYFTSYFVMFFFIPFFNILLNALSKKQYQSLVITCVLLYCVLALFAQGFFNKQIGEVNRGYSFVWLSVLYIIGGGIRKFEKDIKITKKKAFLGYIVCIMSTYLSKMLLQIFLGKEHIELSDFFVQYNSPFILLGAIFLVLIFIKLNINSGKIIDKVAKVSFGVYLISDHPVIREVFVTKNLAGVWKWKWYGMVIYVLGMAFLIYVVCSAIEYIRKKCFEFVNAKCLGCIWQKVGRSK